MGWPHTRLRNRVKLIRRPQRADTTPAEVAVPDRCAQAPRLAALYKSILRGKCRLPVPFAGFLPRLGVCRRQGTARSPCPHAMNRVRCLYIGAQSAAVDSATAPSIRGEGGALGWAQTACCGAHNSSGESTEAIRKYQIETIACRKTSITNACYLCNTLWKRGEAGPLEAVPLLRVQKSSVIVIGRRRGASRGRPVLGGSLKSLAFMRECPKARSD